MLTLIAEFFLSATVYKLKTVVFVYYLYGLGILNIKLFCVRKMREALSSDIGIFFNYHDHVLTKATPPKFFFLMQTN